LSGGKLVVKAFFVCGSGVDGWVRRQGSTVSERTGLLKKKMFVDVSK
jgi:hypothetical protein